MPLNFDAFQSCALSSQLVRNLLRPIVGRSFVQSSSLTLSHAMMNCRGLEKRYISGSI